MMYIEYSPLENQLHTFLSNPAAAAGLLSDVGEATVTEDPRRREQSQATDNAGTINSNGASTKVTVAVEATNGVADNIENKRAEVITTLPATSRLAKEAILPDRELILGQVEIEQEEEEEHYEILNVIQSDTYEDEKEERGQLQQIPITVETEEETEQETSGSVLLEVESEDFKYLIVRIPKSAEQDISAGKRTLKYSPIANKYSYTQRKEQIPKQKARSYTSFSRPENNHKAPRLLNGSLLNFQHRDSRFQSSGDSNLNCSLVSNKSSQRKQCNCGHNVRNFISSRRKVNVEEQNRKRDRRQRDQYSAHNTVEKSPNYQMGLDILNKLRNLLTFNLSSVHNSDDNQRKRRCSDWTADAADGHHIKYRKVDNNFPKYIIGPLESDDVDPFPYPKRPEKPLILQQHQPKQQQQQQQQQQHCPNNRNRNMAQHSTPLFLEMPKQRKSPFATPPVTHQVVRNRSYTTEIEFSDDEVPEVINGFDYNGPITSNRSNIPHSECAEERFKFPNKSPPPLIEYNAGVVIVSPPAADLRANRTIFASTRATPFVQACAPSTISSSGDSNSESLQDNTVGCLRGTMRSNPWTSKTRSILVQERASQDHEKYQALLRQLVPRIYGTGDTISNPHLTQETTSAPGRKCGSLPAAKGTFLNSEHQRFPTIRAPVRSNRVLLSSTIDLADDDSDEVVAEPHNAVDNDNDDDDEAAIVVNSSVEPKNHFKNRHTGAIIIDDDDISDIIDLGDDDRNILQVFPRPKFNVANDKIDGRAEKANNTNIEKKASNELPYVEPVNTLQLKFSTSPHLKDNWLQNFQTKWAKKKMIHREEAKKYEAEVQKHSDVRRVAELEIQERLRNLQVVSADLVVIDDFPEPVEEEETEFIELNDEYQDRIKSAICGPNEQVLITKFHMSITRRDIHTLLGHNWLNDEVINFYMNLLMDRGEKPSMPRVYAMNTFFIPRLMQAGYSGVKRWTRKVDLFAYDIIPIPVHVGGVHWCMAIVHLRNRTIKYYDSMGTPNHSVLKALEQYLKEESLDKKKTALDTSHFDIESVRDVPRQMNGSDCGVFSCMFAEYITRNKEITFSQQHMEYFRHKMILEIVQGQLLQ